MRHNNHQLLRNDQSGIVSIIVTVVLMLVISLITLSFAKIIRQQQAQQLDRQLSSRAFYAAESGVNIAEKKVHDKLALDPTFSVTTTGCTAPELFDPSDSLDIDTATNTKVTCISVNTDQKNLFYSDISNKAKIVSLNSKDNNFSSIKFAWSAVNPNGKTASNCGPSNKFSSSATTFNCGAPLLRVDLVPVDGNLDRATLQARTFTAYFFPRIAGAGLVDFGNVTGANMGGIVAANCTNAANPSCSVTVNTTLGGKHYKARIISLYGDSQLTITGQSGVLTTTFIGAQMTIDSTAKSQDVLRRIQVRKSIADTTAGANSSLPAPDAAIVSANGLCKLWLVLPAAEGGIQDSFTGPDPNSVCGLDYTPTP